MFYEALKDVTEHGKQRWMSGTNLHVNNSFEGLVLGGLAGGMSCALRSSILQYSYSTMKLRKLFCIINFYSQ